MKRILLTGAAGQVGRELQQTLAPIADVISATRDTIDFSQPDAVQQWVISVKPDVIVNAAAYTAVDKAESEPDLATIVNAKTPGLLAEVASQIGAGLIHFSTDYVFNGQQGCPYRETDPTQPLGAYGQSKLAGEEAIRLLCPTHHMIIRTAWVYGANGKTNFVKTMLRLGADRPQLRVVADQIGSPTWAKDLAQATTSLMAQLNPDTAGTYHYTNSGVCSWYDFAIAIFEEAKQLGFPLAIEEVVPITTADYPTPAQRPSFSVLSLQKVSQLLGHHPPHWRQSLRLMLAELKNQ